MIPGEMDHEIIAQAEEIFGQMTPDEIGVVRLHAAGWAYDQIGEMTGISASSAKSAMYRACRRIGVKPARIAYLVGVHDARAHSAAFREDEVHVIVTRRGETQRITV